MSNARRVEAGKGRSPIAFPLLPCLIPLILALLCAGGAVFVDELFLAEMTITKTSFTGNSGYDGGALFLMANASLNDCTVTGNTATRDGGAVRFTGVGAANARQITVSSSSFIGNSAGSQGGAIKVRNAHPACVGPAIRRTRASSHSHPLHQPTYSTSHIVYWEAVPSWHADQQLTLHRQYS